MCLLVWLCARLCVCVRVCCLRMFVCVSCFADYKYVFVVVCVSALVCWFVDLFVC